MAFTNKNDAELLGLLQQFTGAGAAEWLLKHDDEAAFVYCFVAGERIDFVVYGGVRGDELVPVSSSDIAAVGGRWRHHELLFLAPEDMHPTLLPLLRRAVPDLPRWQELTRQATHHAFDALHRVRAAKR
jgi:hypothetical protein